MNKLRLPTFRILKFEFEFLFVWETNKKFEFRISKFEWREATFQILAFQVERNYLSLIESTALIL
jgi:hypothetical protein